MPKGILTEKQMANLGAAGIDSTTALNALARGLKKNFGGAAEDANLTLGSGQFIPGFEEQLVGAKPGDSVVVKVTFPAEYQAAKRVHKAEWSKAKAAS